MKRYIGMETAPGFGPIRASRLVPIVVTACRQLSLDQIEGWPKRGF